MMNSLDNWHEGFFQGMALEFWRQAMTPRQTVAEVDFLEEALAPRRGALLLDVPCGNGRHALELARRGYRVSGVDVAEEFLEEARRSGAEMASLEFVRTDMRELPWQGRFSGAYCLGNSFGYADRDGTRAFVQAVARALRPRGRFVLETGMAAESVLPNFREREWVEAGDILLLLEHTYDATAGRMNTSFTFIRGAQRETRLAHHWVFTVGEIVDMLEQAGLTPIGIYSSLARHVFHLGSPHLLLVAAKS